MKPNEEFAKLATPQQIEKAAAALRENGFSVEVLEGGEEARKRVLELVPEGAKVFTLSSQTLEQTGIAKAIDESGKYNSVRKKLMSLDRQTQGRQMAKLGAAPDWALGSVHAVTQDGHLLIASNTGSQLPAEAYGAEKVIFAVGAQKIVKDTQEGMRRIYEYSYPLEDERAQKAYGVRSGVNKILIINKEVRPGRITVLLVKEKLGF